MNSDQQYDIIKKIEELRGSNAKVSFHLNNFSTPYIAVHTTGTGYQITDVCNCKRVESCIQISDYNAIIKVLNKIIKQAKNN